MSARHTRRFLPGRILPAVMLAVVAATTVIAVPPGQAEAAEPVKPFAAQKYKPVPVAKPQATKAARTPDPTVAAANVTAPAPAWPSAGTADAALPAVAADAKATTASPVRAGRLPVLVAPARNGSARAPGAVRVQTFDRASADKAGVNGLLIRLSTPAAATPSPVEVTVEYGAFATAYGADWSSRLRLVALPDCADGAACKLVELPTRNNIRNKTATATVQAVSAAGTMVALAAGPSGGAGSFTASDLKPSSTWGHSGSTGDFTWNYPMQVPPPASGPAPQIGLSYSAQSIDGRTAVSNNQPGPVGEGFDITQAYIERRYKTCSDDMGDGANNTTKTDDLCWGTDNAILSMQGRSGELLKSSDGRWHSTAEDGAKIELLTTTAFTNGAYKNEYWKLTAADGTEYWFGRHQLPGWTLNRPTTNSVLTVPVFGNNPGELCNASTFAASSCVQAWRWNLDYVVDPYGNTMSYWYSRDTNKYARNAVSTTPVDYYRAGYLERIDYGTDNRDGTEYTATSPYTSAPQQVVFTNSDRCKTNCSTFTESAWPDTPIDLDCTRAPNNTKCLIGSPTFWSSKRVTQVTTKVSGAEVDRWTLDQDWLNQGDDIRKGLWLKGISYTGLNGGSVTYPSVTFSGIQKDNRVDANGSDWAPAMTRWRVNSIRNETGGEIFVTYSDPDCIAKTRVPTKDTVDKNPLRCYPVRWQPQGQTTDVTDYFHKYVVTDIRETDHAGGSKPILTHYDYRNPDNLPLWHYDDDDGLVPVSKKTWGDWRGYPTVVTTVGEPGEQTKTETLYFRGMHGDLLSDGTKRTVTVEGIEGGPATDYDAFAGNPREQIIWNGSAISSATVTDWWQSAASAARTIGKSTVEARYYAADTVRTRVALDNGRWRRTKTINKYDAYGMVTETADLGDEATTTDDQCEATEYARRAEPTGPWLLTPVKRSHSWSGSCATGPIRDAQVISDTRYSFDGADYGDAPTSGKITKTETISGFSGSGRTYHVDGTAKYDPQGRITDATDVTGATTHTDYTPAAGGPLTKTVVKNALNWATTTEFDPARSLPTKVTDHNNRVTEVAYDPAGRTVSVWSPSRPKGTWPTAPTTSYAYTITKADGDTVKDTSVVTTKTLDANGKYQTTYTLYDGLSRPRQTQATALGGETPTEKIVTDTFYDSAGRLWKSNDAHVMPGLPTGKVRDGLSEDLDIPRQNRYVYDAVGRLTDTILVSENKEKWRTTTSYHGDHTDVTQPQGGIGTSTWTDARGRTTALRQFHGRTPTGAYEETTTQYSPLGSLERVQDAAGNTWTFTYDVRGRQTYTYDPDRGGVTLSYNAKDQLETVTDAEQQTLAYTYDAIGRKKTVRDGSVTGTVRADWTYDTPYKGATAKSTRYVGTNAYTTELLTADAEYRPTQIRTTIPSVTGEEGLAGTYSTRYTYKADGSPNSITLPAAGGLAGETLTYEYDPTYAMPTSLKTNYAGAAYYVNLATYTNLYEPSSISRSTQLTGAGFVSSSQTYEESTGRIIQRRTGRNVGTSVIANTEIKYDAAGNVLWLDDNAAAGRDKQCFQYDHLRRLTEAWTPASYDCSNLPTSTSQLGGPAPYWQSWEFGAPDNPIGRTGNRLKEVDHTATGNVVTDYTYPDAGGTQPHAVTTAKRTDGTSAVTTGYTYDKNGNTKTRPGDHGQQTLTWDPEGKLTTLTDEAGSNSYLYDADGNRLLSRDPTGITLELGSAEVRLAKGSTQSTATRYYSFGDQLVGQRDASGLRWLATDHQGTSSATVTADAQQNLTLRRQTPYGEDRGPAAQWVNSRGFLGGQEDPTGLTHLGAREYDPGLGKFISVDPIQDLGNPQQWNAYTYATNNPITFSDPSGLIARENAEGGAPTPATGGGNDVGGNSSTTAGTGEPRRQETTATSSHAKNPWTAGVKGVWNSAYDQTVGGVVDAFKATYDQAQQDAIAINNGEMTLTDAIWGQTKRTLWGGPGSLPGTINMIKGIYEQGKAAFTADNAVDRSYHSAYFATTLVGLAVGGKGVKGTKGTKSGAATSGKGGATSSAEGGAARAGGKCDSFAPGTLVLLAGGATKAIENLKIGDQIVAGDPETGETAVETVEAVRDNLDQDLTDITVTTEDGKSAVVETTAHHLFWSGSLGDWKAAGELRSGDLLSSTDASANVMVSEVETFGGLRRMFNLTVSNLHTYYVLAGKTPVLVHNCGGVSVEREMEMAGMLRDAARQKGFSGIGSGTRAESDMMGSAWVGPNYKVASDGRTMISQDGLRQYRPPSFKPNRPERFGGPGYQANFEWRVQPKGQWQADAHLNILD